MSRRLRFTLSLAAAFALTATIALALHHRMERMAALDAERQAQALALSIERTNEQIRLQRTSESRGAAARIWQQQEERRLAAEEREAEEISAALHEQEVEAAALEAARHVIQGRVTNLAGLPLAGVITEIDALDRRTQTDQEGHFSLSDLDNAPVDLCFHGSEPPYLTSELSDVHPGGNPLNVRLGWAPATVSGAVLNEETSSPHTVFTVIVNHFDLLTNSHTGTDIVPVRDSRGEFEISLDQPGRHQVLVRVGESRPVTREVLVSEGGQRFPHLQFRVPPLTEMADTGIIAGALQAPAGSRVATAGDPAARSGAAGEFILNRVPPGNHTLVVMTEDEQGNRRVTGTLPNVEVRPGALTDLGSIDLQRLTPVQQGG